MRIRLAVLASLLAAPVAIGCATPEQPFVWIANVRAPDLKPDGVIRPRDSIVVVVRDHNDLSGEFAVRDDGGILFPTIGDVHVGDKSIETLTTELHGRFSAVVVNPNVTISISKLAPIRVSVVGEVKTPATYELSRDRTVAAALAAAGWLTEFADRDRIFVVRRESDRRVRFRASEITSSEPAVARFRLGDGDVVVAE
jgi:polysaccharide biosynthesis/export protein